MNKILAAAALSLLSATAAFAADPTTSPVPSSSPAAVSSPATPVATVAQKPVSPKPMSLKGSIVSIDSSAKTLVIKVGTKDETFQLGDVKPMKNKKEIQLADLKAGSKVTGSAINQNGQEMLQSLSLQ
jgi:hypothetical protein